MAGELSEGYPPVSLKGVFDLELREVVSNVFIE